MDSIPSMLSRRGTCVLCSFISTIVIRRDDFNTDRTVFLKFTATIGLSAIVKGGTGDEEEIGDLKVLDVSESVPQPDLTLDRSVFEKIDWPAVKKWIEDSPQKDNLDNYPTDFRLIDVENLCVVRARKPCEYACLSYVWGKDTSYQATLDTIHMLEQPNSLGTWDNLEQRSMIENSDVPATIKDAIVACSAIGKRYLWVDRLCIVQDEDEENNPSKKEQINAMGDIYRCSVVTMVALEGASATIGLHGVSLSRLPYCRVRIGDQILLDRELLFINELGRSTWNKRGWTYQEAILSPRLLFFTKHGLWYDHDLMQRTNSDIQEWACSKIGPAFSSKSIDKIGNSGWEYIFAAMSITDREFGYESDIINGFSGVLNSFFGKDHRFAIPLEDFDYALIWQPYNGPSQKRQSQGNYAFPSWSWASIMSRCLYHPHDRIMPVASWVFLDGNDTGQAPWPRTEGHTLEDIVIGSILWRTGCMIEPFPDCLYFKGNLGDYAHLFQENWPTKEKFLEECRGLKPNSQERCRLLERFDEKQIAVGRKPGVVLGYSQAAVLILDKEFYLYHGHKRIGWMEFQFLSDYTEALEVLQTGPVGLLVFGLSASWRPSRAFEDCWDWHDDINLQTGTLGSCPSGIINTFIPNLGDPNNTMNVMALRTLNGISYRMGLGQVILLDWLKLKRTFKAIMLQ